MPFRALDTILQGAAPAVEAGEQIPETYRDLDGTEHPHDFDRLVDLGVAEKVSARKSQAKD